jgi:phosphoserine phosphatase RsbX
VLDANGARVVELAVVGRPRSGEPTSGDDSVATPTADGISVVVADGLGHGPEAVQAARTAVRSASCRAGESVVSIMSECHEALRGSRGAAVSMAAVSAAHGTLTWLGVGNVAGTLTRGRRTGASDHMLLPLLDGVVGHELPGLRPTTVPISRGDVLVMTTDGVRGGLDDPVSLAGSTASIAERALARSTANDDALVLVLRYLGLRQ